MNRPALTPQLSPTDFSDFYWLKEELVAFCKQHGLSASGSKVALNERIVAFLSTGEIPQEKKEKQLKQSKFNWKTEKLSPATLITDSYTNTEHVRQFFLHHIGKHFAFHVRFMNWMKSHAGHSLQEAIDEWKRMEVNKETTEIAPQFEYNRYIRAFLADNPQQGLSSAIQCWKHKRNQRGTNAYEPSDLAFLQADNSMS